MRHCSLVVPTVLLALTVSAAAQTSPQRDPQAVLLVQKTVLAMGGVAPGDSTATGTITLVAGSENDSGTVTVLTRGVAQTAEELQMSEEGYRAVIYSAGSASLVKDSTNTPLRPELAATSQSPDFPLPLLVAALNNADFSFQYIGPETVDGASAYHLRFWDTYASSAQLQGLADFTTRDVWISSTSGLPIRLEYDRREAGGSAPRIPMQVDYANYTNVQGVLYPFSITKSKNGTPWITITVQQVLLNTGLSDSNFPVD